MEILKNKFMTENMQRQFVRRPSVSYRDISNLDTLNEIGRPDEVLNGLGQILSVNGFTLSSNFVVNLTIRIKGSGGCFDKDWHEYSTQFPIYIRSKTLRRERVADVEQLGLLPNSLKQNI